MTGQVGPLSAHEAAFAVHFVGVHPGDVQASYDLARLAGGPGLVVGMAPGPNTSEHLPMFPWPEGSAGGPAPGWEAGGVAFAVIPHPSGHSREYNDPAAVERARAAVRWAARWEGE